MAIIRATIIYWSHGKVTAEQRSSARPHSAIRWGGIVLPVFSSVLATPQAHDAVFPGGTPGRKVSEDDYMRDEQLEDASCSHLAQLGTRRLCVLAVSRRQCHRR